MSTSVAPHAAVSNLQPGDHLCCIYETDKEHRVLLTSCLRQGFERNEKVVYIVDDRMAETVLGYPGVVGFSTGVRKEEWL